ncbi:thiamine-monophosphate kinase [Sphaerotilus hippei]|uniref:Thiamine-monophosphate kinase n=1 Tax=Sphaerotilus hippei TaxID=744406 RepID=A0A318HAS5_9BURK|nr:thiamine-phosphate kinase [Sphaerotilus hippei]PXW95821.1 thiamine-monophosphate kinase [Sphaerotilus hippei]
MSLGEFDLIARYFDRPVRRSPLGIGDDCALLAPSPGMQLAVSTDMLVEGRHFLSTVAPDRLGHKALAVNLSDLAACGARPLAFTLALSLPRAEAPFLAGLARGLFALADRHDIELVGGDTTSGPLNLCITVFGEVPAGGALLRSGARPGDELWVSHPLHDDEPGWLGDARLALEVFRGTPGLHVPGEAFERLRLAMECPQPRVALGQALRGLATSTIDISDGLMGDLSHVLKRSGAVHGEAGRPLGARLEADWLPRSPLMRAQDDGRQLECLLAGGDDYELLFTAAPERHEAVLAAGRHSATGVRRIGHLTTGGGLEVVGHDGQRLATPWASFDHFRA